VLIAVVALGGCADDGPAGDPYRPDLIALAGTVCTADPAELGASEPLVLKQIVVSNTNLLFGRAGFAVDSDGDGTSDEDESATSSALTWDRDGDGVSDAVELRVAAQDPGVADRPMGCPTVTADTDGDGLNGCEEYILGTDPVHGDSDGDGFPDALEVWAGTDPTTAGEDALDSDGDGWTNSRELSAHSDPIATDASGREAAAYIYDISPAELVDQRNCREVEISNIALTTTQAAVGALDDGIEHEAGSNHLVVWITQGRADDLSAPGLTTAFETRVVLGCINPTQLVSCVREPANATLDLSELTPW